MADVFESPIDKARKSALAAEAADDESWLHILVNFPHLVKAPIAIKKDKAVLCITPLEVLKLT